MRPQPTPGDAQPYDPYQLHPWCTCPDALSDEVAVWLLLAAIPDPLLRTGHGEVKDKLAIRPG